jgi:hypothetical protein
MLPWWGSSVTWVVEAMVGLIGARTFKGEESEGRVSEKIVLIESGNKE